MPRLTPGEAVARAHAVFEQGDRRAAWEALRARARHAPDEAAYRTALVETYRAAGHPDQAARWGAATPELLTERERALLVRTVRRAESDRALREYLALPTVPADLVPFMPSVAVLRRRAAARWGSELVLAAAIVGVIGAIAVGIGIVVTLVQAFIGGRAQEAAQITVTGALFVVVVVGFLLLVVTGFSRQWVRASLLVAVVVGAVLVLARADMTSTLPFG